MAKEKKRSLFDRFIQGVEVAGNKLPTPFTLFLYLIIIICVLSFVLSSMGVSVTYMAAGKNGAEMKETTVAVVNLLSKEQFKSFLTDFTKTFIEFPPLGLLMIMMMGIGFVEETGFINALMRKTLLSAPSFLITAVLAFVGVNANIASDAGMIFTATIGAILFKSLGRNPYIGIIIGFAAGSGGFTANLFVAGTDALLSGISESAAEAARITTPIHPLINYYFMATATFIVTGVVTLIAEKYIIPKLDSDSGTLEDKDLASHELTDLEKKGLSNAGIATIIYIIIILALSIPKNGLLRADNGTILPKSPLISGIVPLIFFFFLTVGITYGRTTKYITSEKDIPNIMRNSLSGALTFLVVVLPSSIFIKFFNESKLTTVMAVKGSELLKKANMGVIPLLLSFILLVALVNMFMTSGSSKWLILAPIFVPMFAMLNLSPAVSQVAFRVGDSATNIISPISSSLAVVIGIMEQYNEKKDEPVGIGTVIALTLPFALGILLSMSLLLILWVTFDIPLGPGANIFLS
ncbi:AbgT family transporter [Clostridium tetani]|uniref:AbgT family transporter n=1 Tax=Clostridium tetani TaxID=1513 RepID=UPI0024A8C606|nr:AbgT family transporter [Clostridium tetani]